MIIIMSVIIVKSINIDNIRKKVGKPAKVTKVYQLTPWWLNNRTCGIFIFSKQNDNRHYRIPAAVG